MQLSVSSVIKWKKLVLKLAIKRMTLTFLSFKSVTNDTVYHDKSFDSYRDMKI